MHQVPAAIIDVVRMPEPDLPAVPDVFLFARVLSHRYQRVTVPYADLLPDPLARARNA